MRDLRLRCILIVFAATVLFTVPLSARVFAQDDVRQADLDSLEAKLYFVGKLAAKYPDSGFAGTWSLLESDVREAIGRHDDAEAFHALRRRVLLTWGKYHEDAARPDLAIEPYETLAREYDGGPEFRTAVTAVAGIHMARAEAAEGDAEKLEAYRNAYDQYERIDDAGKLAEIRSRVIDLQAREGIRLAEEKQYGKAFELLTELREREGSLGEGRAAEVLAMLREKTGVLTVRLMDVKARGDAVSPEFTLVLKAKGGGESTEIPFATPFRWLAGEYEVGLRKPGEDTPAARENVTIAADGVEVVFPRVFPDNMVYVKALEEGEKPFFIDRTEVSEAAYKAFDAKYRRPTAATGENLPAHGITYEKAMAYAESVGKKLPTEEQWIRAAFLGRKMRYPWGPETEFGGHPSKYCHVSDPDSARLTGPGPVDGFQDYKSPCGALNMAGNVWEWLRDEHAIGGGFGFSRLEHDLGWKSGPTDFLRQKKPTERLRLSRGFPEPAKYKRYKVHNRNMQEVGIRCVIEL